MTSSPMQIAQWMYEQYKVGNRLVQQPTARQIRGLFGEEHVYRNRNGNWAIRKPILDAFREITGNEVVWSRGDQLWRARRATDPPNTRMVR